MSRYFLKVLGPPLLEGAEGGSSNGLAPSIAGLLAYLALQPRPVTRDHLARLFWPRAENGRARHSLRQLLSRVRSLAPGLVTGEGELVALQAEVLEVDARLFEEEIAAGRLERALSLWRGPLLEGWSWPESWELAEWVERERHRLERLLEAATVRWAEPVFRAGGQAGEAVSLLSAVRALLPASEGLVVLHARALAAAGRGPEAEALLAAADLAGPEEEAAARELLTEIRGRSSNGAAAIPSGSGAAAAEPGSGEGGESGSLPAAAGPADRGVVPAGKKGAERELVLEVGVGRARKAMVEREDRPDPGEGPGMKEEAQAGEAQKVTESQPEGGILAARRGAGQESPHALPSGFWSRAPTRGLKLGLGAVGVFSVATFAVLLLRPWWAGSAGKQSSPDGPAGSSAPSPSVEGETVPPVTIFFCSHRDTEYAFRMDQDGGGKRSLTREPVCPVIPVNGGERIVTFRTAPGGVEVGELVEGRFRPLAGPFAGLGSSPPGRQAGPLDGVITPDGASMVLVVEQPGELHGPAAQRRFLDGIGTSDSTALLDLYLLDLVTGRLEQLTDDPARDYTPRITPDGSGIVFGSQRDGNGDLYFLDLTSRRVRRLTWGDRPARDPSVQGEWVAFLRGWGDGAEEGDQELYLLNLATGVERRLTFNTWNDAEVELSSDARLICWTSKKEGHFEGEILAMELESGREWDVSAALGREDYCQWHPAAPVVFYLSWGEGSKEIFRSQWGAVPPGVNLSRYDSDDDGPVIASALRAAPARREEE